ncbi:MAG: HAMP domain-containing histidine kinase [Actinomycetia bacterium]|nr:HAMP domain-containing histidine kinase [Actinomycetes bacterium]
MKALDLRSRLLTAIALVAVLQIVVAFVVVSVTRNDLVAQIDDRLAVAASHERNRAIDPFRPPPLPAGEGLIELERLGDTYEGVLSSDGSLLTYFAPNTTGIELSPPNINLERAEMSEGRPITVDTTGDDIEYRLIAVGREDGGYFITAIPLDGVNATMSRLGTVVALTVVAITLVLALVTWWVLRLGIAPIKRMTTSAEAIAAGDLSERLTDVDQSTEAGQLGLALNTMLGQIESSFEERKLAEERLRRFVADASHELRTPVATIRGYAELYRVGALDNRADLDDAMRRTEQESHRMSRLIADMLNLAKLDREPVLTTLSVDLTSLVSDASADAQATHPDRTITAAVPDGAVFARGSEDLLRQALTNLVGNAIAHTDTAAVNINLRTDGPHAIVEVVDDGEGMEPHVAARATERFYRADPSRSRHRGGSGLGLAIVESVVKAHNGTLRIDSTLGSGTTVSITLPLVPPEHPGSSDQERTGTTTSSQASPQ